MRHFVSGAFAVAISLLAGCGQTQQGQSFSTLSNASVEDKVYVRLPSAMISQDFIAKSGFERDHGKHPLFALGWLSRSSLSGLSSEDKLAITELDESETMTGSLNPFTGERQNLFANLKSTNVEDYHNYEALTGELKTLADRYSDLATIESIGKSVAGRELWLMRLTSPVGNAAEKPKLLYIANMHGDEVVGRELSIYLIRMLLSEYGSSPRFTELLDQAEIFIVPSMNPDGFERARRFNNRGVDLNRDFPDFTIDNNDTLAGRALETQAIMKLHERFHFVASLNYHGGDVCFNLPWDTIANDNPRTKFGDDHILNPMGRAYADSNPTMRANNSFDRGLTYGFEWYLVNGGMQDWSIYYRQSMHATVELSMAKWPPKTYLPVAWSENKEGMTAFLERSLKGVHVKVSDETGAPVKGFTLKLNSSNRDVTFKESYGSRTASQGLQTATIQAPGFLPVTLELESRLFSGEYTSVVLYRNGL